MFEPEVSLLFGRNIYLVYGCFEDEEFSCFMTPIFRILQEEVWTLEPMVPPKRFDISPP